MLRDDENHRKDGGVQKIIGAWNFEVISWLVD